MNPTLQVRLPLEIKEKAIEIIKLSGLTPSDVVRGVMTRIANEGVLPVDLFMPNKETLDALTENNEDLPVFETVEDLFKDLYA